MKIIYIIIGILIFTGFITMIVLMFKKNPKHNKDITILRFEENNKPNKKPDKSKIVPKILHLTYKDFIKVPEKVFEAWKMYAPFLEIRRYTDEDCITFLSLYFSKDIVEKFKSFKMGMHKADPFRYCVLYIHGGYYADIDLQPLRYLPTCQDNSMTTILGYKNKTIFQAFLATYPRNQIFLEWIMLISRRKRVIRNDHVKDLVLWFRKNNIDLIPGVQQTIKGKIMLYLEDGYTSNMQQMYVYEDGNNDPLFKSRYVDYPWNK